MGTLSWVIWAGQSRHIDPESREVSLAGGRGAAGEMRWRGVSEAQGWGRTGCAIGATVRGHGPGPQVSSGSSEGSKSCICRNLPSHNQVDEPGRTQ